MWLKDPKTSEKSVSLTMLTVSFVSVIGCSFAQIFGYLDGTGPLMELFYATTALYFGRRVKFGKGEISESSVGQG